MPNNQIQSLTVNGVTYDIVDNTSGYITTQYIENKTDYSIPVSRVGEIVVGETAIGTDSTNFPTSKAVVDYVDERVVQEMDAIDVGVTGIKANGTSLSVVDGVVSIPIVGPNQSVGLMTNEYMEGIDNSINNISNSIPTSTSQLTNDSGFITSETDPTVPSWAKQSSKPTYTAAEVGALPDSTVIPSKVSDLTNDSGFISSYTETDPVFTASAAAGITSTDISNWNAKVSDDKTWNGVTLSQGLTYTAADQYIPVKATNALSGTASQTVATPTPTQYRIAKYDNNACLNSTTPSANDNSTKVATTAYVDNAIPKVYSSTNTGGYLTMATLPIYDGTVE